MQISRSRDMHIREFIALMAFINLLTAVAIDIMLPAFNGLRTNLGLGPDSTAVAQIVTFFLLGQSGQLIFGPLADRFGRIPVLRLGFGLYIAGCIATVIIPILGWILVARFVVGLGAAAMSVSTNAMIRDQFEGDDMARVLSLILTIFLGVPVVAPIAGIVILSVSSWQIVFLTPAIIAILVFVWAFRLNETLSANRRNPLEIRPLMNVSAKVLRNRTFLRYAAISTILFGAFSSFVGSSERIVGTVYGQPELFVPIFAIIGFVMAIITFLNSQLVQRYGARRIVQMVSLIYFVIGLFLTSFIVLASATPPMFIFFACAGLLQAFFVVLNANSTALALEPLGDTAGMASAIYGTSFFVLGGILGSFIDRFLVESVAALAIAYAIGGFLIVILVYLEKRERISADESEQTFLKLR